MQLQHIIDSSDSISRRELARLVGLDVSVVQKAIDIAALPASVIAAFSSASEIQYRDAKPLKDAVAQARDPVIACAESIKGQEIPSKEVTAKLVQAAEAAAAAALANDQAPGVEPFNTPARPLPIEVDGQTLGSFAIDKKASSNPPCAATQPQTASRPGATDSKISAQQSPPPGSQKACSQKAAAEILEATANQPAANDSQATGKERA